MDFNDISENSIRKILEFRNESIFQNEDYFLVIIRDFENITYSVALTAKKSIKTRLTEIVLKKNPDIHPFLMQFPPDFEMAQFYKILFARFFLQDSSYKILFTRFFFTSFFLQDSFYKILSQPGANSSPWC